MVVVATSLYGTPGLPGLISSPVGISGTVYFVDEDYFAGVYVSGCVIRSYSPGVGLNNSVFPDTLYSITGMNAVHMETAPELSLVAARTDVSGNKIYFYNPEPGIDEWTSGTPSDATLTDCFPFTFSVSGSPSNTIAAFATDGAFTPGVYIQDRDIGDEMVSWTKLTTDNVEIPAGWFIRDMTYATSRGVGSAGRIYVNTFDVLNNSSAVIMYTLPTSAPFTTGSWSDVTPDCLSSGTIYVTPDTAKYCHVGITTRATTGTGTDDVFLIYAETDWVDNWRISLRHVSGTIWDYTGRVPPYYAYPNKPGIFSEIGGNLLFGSADVAL